MPEESTCEDVAGECAGDQRLGKKSCAVVGIGASAGGLEAFKQLLENLPDDTGMAFVLVQHLDPSHKSMLSEIFSKSTSMPVSEVKDKTVLKPDCVYIIPPGKAMCVSNGLLNLLPRADIARPFMPVDYFLESLAKDQGGRAIGVILSGTAADGCRGLKEIKNAGGITFAQKPQTARFDGMPLNAVAAGVVDYILTPQKIAGELAKIACSTAFNDIAVENGNLFSDGAAELKQIFAMLRIASGTDFSMYRDLTIKRRILRRMVMHRIEKLGDYVIFLQDNPAEVKELYQDLLINVTSFFRDQEAFETLKSMVFPAVMKNKQPGEHVRVWVPGCSTGEEAYSLAILLIESLGDVAVNTQIQIFATDTNETLIKKARSGVYPASIKAVVSPERLCRFFTVVDTGYQIGRSIRDMCVFARQDMANDPPFSRLDLISCRNAIIYFGRAMQKKIFPTFHYALNQKGFLFLGSSESVGAFSNLFNLEDKKHKIYSKKAVHTPIITELAAADYAAATVECHEKTSKISHAVEPKFKVLEEANRIILNQYTPAGVVVNSDLEIIQFRGRTGYYLEPASGTPSLKLLKMARDGLSLGLHSAIKQAREESVPVRKEGLRVVNNGPSERVNIDVIPFGEPHGEKYFLVLFEKPISQDLPPGEKAGGVAAESQQAAPYDESNRLIALEHELAATKEYLKSVVEQHELTNEALRAANEEIQSSNEELQSMNEELGTAKEELQSSNEELMTLNDEVQNRNIELVKISSDLQNLFRSVNIPVIMLDGNLNIRLFNHSAEKTLRLIATDAGRPITDINLNFNNLEQAILEVNETLISTELEMQDSRHGCWYSVQIRPYRTIDNKIDGVVITFVDISIIKEILEQSQEARIYAEAIVETVQEPLLVLDDGLRIRSVNKAFYQTFMVTPEETLGRNIFNLGNGQWDIPELRVLLEEIIPENVLFEDFKVDHDFPGIGRKMMLVNARRIVSAENQTKLILMTIEDKTDQ
ncbi:MAG: chemotaxis protein CheB, partial [Desulfotomaculaceae bacterium]|nr:chemotaxis protein CheB [Desulfotomaculaceae bacterium]